MPSILAVSPGENGAWISVQEAGPSIRKAIIQDQQVFAAQFLRTLDQGPHFPLEGIGIGNVRADLDQTRHSQAFFDHKIDFLILWAASIKQRNPSGDFFLFKGNGQEVFVKNPSVRAETKSHRNRHFACLYSTRNFIFLEIIL
jgi:hypothetical protein